MNPSRILFSYTGMHFSLFLWLFNRHHASMLEYLHSNQYWCTLTLTNSSHFMGDLSPPRDLGTTSTDRATTRTKHAHNTPSSIQYTYVFALSDVRWCQLRGIFPTGEMEYPGPTTLYSKAEQSTSVVPNPINEIPFLFHADRNNFFCEYHCRFYLHLRSVSPTSMEQAVCEVSFV